MSKNSRVNISVGSGSFWSLLTVALIVLKLTGFITWSWLWVLAPLWIPIAFFVSIFILISAIIILVFLCAFACALVDEVIYIVSGGKRLFIK